MAFLTANATVISPDKGTVRLDPPIDLRLAPTEDKQWIQSKKILKHFAHFGVSPSNKVIIRFYVSYKGTRVIKWIKNIDEVAPVEISKPESELHEMAAKIAELAEVDAIKGAMADMMKIDLTSPTLEPAAKTPKAKDKKFLNGYFIDEDTRRTFTTAHKMSLANPETAVKVMMVGPSGYGKTTVPKLLAKAAHMEFYRMNCATIRDPEEWFGYREAVDGSTQFFRSEFAKVIEAGNAVIVLDEFNRLEPWLHNTLFPLLDDDGMTVVHDEEFRIGPNVIVVGTINSGYKYTGTFELDEALLNRFEFLIEVGPMPPTQEKKVLKVRTGVDSKLAKEIVDTANALRNLDVVCSTRTTLLVAQMAVSGLTVREAYQSSVVNRIPNDDSAYTLRKDVIDSLNVNCGTLKDRPLDEDIFATQPSKEEEVKKEESSPVGKIEFTMELAKDVPLQKLALIKNIRRLSTTADGKSSKLSLMQTKELVEELAKGHPIGLTVSADGMYVSTDASLDYTLAGLIGNGARTEVIHI